MSVLIDLQDFLTNKERDLKKDQIGITKIIPKRGSPVDRDGERLQINVPDRDVSVYRLSM